MIEKIVLSGIGNYRQKQECLGPLSRVNFIYGSNGSGKSTICNVVSAPYSHQECSVDADGTEGDLEVLVYDQHFTGKMFSDDIKGIFTLGEDNVRIRGEIEQKNQEKRKIEGKISGCIASLDKNKLESEEVLKRLMDKCWNESARNIGKKLFPGLMKGYSRKENFYNKCVAHLKDRGDMSHNFEELKAEYDELHADNVDFFEEIELFNFEDLVSLEGSNILGRRIASSQDTEFTRFMEVLDNQDWVESGIEFHDATENKVCPFCKQATGTSISKAIRACFEGDYRKGIEELEKFQRGYSSSASKLIESLRRLEGHPLVADKNQYSMNLKLLSERTKNNLSSIESKLSSPSKEYSLEKCSDIIDRIFITIEDLRTKVSLRNEKVRNLEESRKAISVKIWEYFAQNISDDYHFYREVKSRTDRAQKGISVSMNSANEDLRKITSEISSLELQVTSAKPTITYINGLLGSFGFDNFHLAIGNKEGTYRVQRPDGKNALATLSEGEKTFITFLYFYYLVDSKKNGEKPLSIFVDDPISSLDSNVLFIVSSLTKQMIRSARDESAEAVRQITVLTHNVYFHKEVSFNNKRKAGKPLGDESFWVIRKGSGHSHIEKYDYNPIVSSYETLWREMREQRDRESLSLPNTLRRIIEVYFKNFGSISNDNILDKFEGSERIICATLFSWVNAQSHHIPDDIAVVVQPQEHQTYISVFKRIFEVTNHEGHYKMMMREI